MTGFVHNVLGGIGHFVQRLEGDIDADLKSAIALLHPSVVVVENAIREHGPAMIQSIAASMASAALAVFAAATGNPLVAASAAGQAAIAAGEAAATAAGIALGKDVLHALATSQVAAIPGTSGTATGA